MQVQHHVRIAGQSLQGQALGLQLGAGGLPGQGIAQTVADQPEVALRIVTELAFDLITDRFAHIDEPAIEVLTAFELEATQRNFQQHLFQTDRIGHWHQYDLAAQPAGGFEFRQVFLEVPGHQHPRHLVGMQ
ncbi:hypothetical protein D3C84_981990 [compost metagenome]